MSLVELTKVVVSEVVTLLALTHCTAEQGRMFVPVTLKESAGLPAAADVCDRETSVGVARGVVGVESVKAAELDVPTVFDTVTPAVPGNAASAGVMEAVSCVALAKVVG